MTVPALPGRYVKLEPYSIGATTALAASPKSRCHSRLPRPTGVFKTRRRWLRLCEVDAAALVGETCSRGRCDANLASRRKCTAPLLSRPAELNPPLDFIRGSERKATPIQSFRHRRLHRGGSGKSLFRPAISPHNCPGGFPRLTPVEPTARPGWWLAESDRRLLAGMEACGSFDFPGRILLG